MNPSEARPASVREGDAGRRVSARRVGRATSPLGWLVCLAIACVPARGGWDVVALEQEAPGITAGLDNRIGDLIPFPSIEREGERIGLIACRYAGGRPVRVRGVGAGWPIEWVHAAVAAVDERVDGIELEIDGADATGSSRSADIEVTMMADAGGPGPRGLGDTLSECNLERPSDAAGAQRGELVGSEIRMRREQLDMLNQIRAASAEEWVGALMHELGHALGFVGHAAAGDSILVLEESALRAAGRRALRSESGRDSTLEALYRLPVGADLGSRAIRDASKPGLEAVRAQIRRRAESGERPVGVLASVGDEQARIVWRYADGSQLGLRMPAWRRELRDGGAIHVEPDRSAPGSPGGGRP